jgi:hypothetical protein
VCVCVWKILAMSSWQASSHLANCLVWDRTGSSSFPVIMKCSTNWQHWLDYLHYMQNYAGLWGQARVVVPFNTLRSSHTQKTQTSNTCLNTCVHNHAFRLHKILCRNNSGDKQKQAWVTKQRAHCNSEMLPYF